MGTEQQLKFDVEDTVFVAVGTDMDDTKATLIWALQNFPGKKFCLLHVHQPSPGAVVDDAQSEFCIS